MAKKKKRRGVKTYRPHNLATILYSLFGLLVIGCFGAFLMMPMFTFAKEGETAIVFKGLDFIIFGVRKYYSKLVTPDMEAFEAYFATATPDNELLKTIINIHGWIELGITVFIAFAALFVFILFVFVFFFIIFGKIKSPKNVKTFSWLTFWFFAIYIGLSFMYFFFYKQIIDSTGDKVSIDLSYICLGILGAMFVICIILFAINKGYFKDRVALEKTKNKESFDEEDEESAPEVAEAPAPMPVAQQNPVQQNQTMQVSEQDFVYSPAANASGVITIGDKAYTKNTEITTANIPEGITSLGSSAFANCVNLTSVTIPSTVQEIGFNCFFNTPKLTKIVFNGTVERWKYIKRGSNWLTKSGTTTVHCRDGQINVNPRR